MKARVWGLVLGMVGCARPQPPDVALVARYEMLRSGPQTLLSIELVWPLEKQRRTRPLSANTNAGEEP